MLRKLWVRWRERGLSRSRDQSIEWCRRRQIAAPPWARAIDSGLWAEAEAFAIEQQAIAERTSRDMGERVGGAGFYPLLYFLTRLIRPTTIVETGVAFGFSSRAFLRGLQDNGGGELFSSDFPYFRKAHPERLIGCLVEPELRRNWTLLLAGDRSNLPDIARQVDRIQLLHYDSDKSYSGRDFALRALGPSLDRDCLILFDDIQDNLHFRDWVQCDGRPFLVFEFNGKWIGLKGGPERLYAAS